MRHRSDVGKVAWVLGGGGLLGAAEVGMIRALTEAGLRPDLVLGTSIGALNGVMVAADPDQAAARLTDLWQAIDRTSPFGTSLPKRASTLVRSRTHLHPIDSMRRLVTDALPVTTFEELQVEFQCVAASIERAGPRWFSTGTLVEPVLASTAVPGLFPPIEVDGEHHYDGGLVHSIPLGRALQLGAKVVYVLQVGRVEAPLQPPSNMLEVGQVTFELARRHRFVEEMATIPEGIEVHVLPTGSPVVESVRTQLRWGDTSRTRERIDLAHAATRAWLAGRA